jgi:hypothetical protein
MSMPPEDSSFDELEKRVKEHIKYQRTADSNKTFFPLWLFLPLIVGMLIKVLDLTEAVLLILLGIILSVAFVKLPEAKLKDFPVEDDEWARIYAHHIVSKLELYFETKSSGIKNEAQFEALRNARSFLFCIEEKWKVGNFKLVKQCEEAISEFKKNIRYKISPAIASGDDNLLQRVSRIMYNLWAYSRTLTLESIETLNKQMSEREDTKLPSKEPSKMDYHKILASLRQTKFLGYVPAVTISGIISAVLGYVGVTYADIDRNYAWGGSIALFGILLGSYFKIKGKAEEK